MPRLRGEDAAPPRPNPHSYPPPQWLDKHRSNAIICMMTQVRTHKPMSPKQAFACCRPVDDLLDPELFKALADPTRTTLLACLVKCGRSCTVTEVAECCSVDFSVVSRHLSLLDRAGVIESRKEGRTVYYSVRYVDLTRTLRALADAIDSCKPGKGKGGCCE